MWYRKPLSEGYTLLYLTKWSQIHWIDEGFEDEFIDTTYGVADRPDSTFLAYVAASFPFGPPTTANKVWY